MTSAYEVALTAGARRQLHALPARVAPAVIEFVTVALAADPLRLSKALRGELDGLRSARRGDFRILLRLDPAAERLVVVRIAHRSTAYRPM